MLRSAASKVMWVGRATVFVVALLLILAVLFVLSASPAHAANLTVNSEADDTTTNENCTLREAISAANTNIPVDACTAGEASPVKDTISFAIPEDQANASGVFTISPSGPGLPYITDPVTIDGYSQSGASPNTNALADGTNAVLKIELDGTNSYSNGLTIAPGGSGSVVKGLVINRFAGRAISVGEWNDSVTDNTTIEGNFIGTDATGMDVPRRFDLADSDSRLGVLINGGRNNTVGGTTAEARNLIAGYYCNESYRYCAGVYMTFDLATNTSPVGNKVQGNYIGTDKTGSGALANSHGVWIQDGSGTTVGGAEAGAGNVISGNDRHGVFIDKDYGTPTTDNQVLGNQIGVGANGSDALGNGQDGVYIDSASGNTVGGTTAGARNVISDNDGSGVRIFDHMFATAEAVNNVVQGNFIGTDKIGTAELGNGNSGVRIEGASDTTVGGTTAGARNVIAFNRRGGIRVDEGSTGNSILSNPIFSNSGLGIDLAPWGVTLNDNGTGDADSGPNDLQNFPVVTSAKTRSTRTIVAGTLDSSSGQDFTVQFFYSPAADSSGYGEGKTLLGTKIVSTDADGKVPFRFTFKKAIRAGQVVTATATSPSGDSSEFSYARKVVRQK